MKVLIVGGSCLLGRYLLASRPGDWPVTATWYTNYAPGCTYQLDVCNPSQVGYVLGRVKPDAVIHLAAIGDVDYAERNYQETDRVNVDGLCNVARACIDMGALLVLASSNAVFRGDAAPYAEDAERRPVNAYGSIRKRAEDELRKTARRWLILRLFLLYGWPPPGARGNWAVTLVEKLSRGERVRLVDDNWWQPTYAGDAARAIWRVLETGQRNEVLHLAGPERMTLLEFGQAVARAWELDEALVEPIHSADLKGIAPRPVDSTYDLAKAESLGLRLSAPAEGLARMREE